MLHSNRHNSLAPNEKRVSTVLRQAIRRESSVTVIGTESEIVEQNSNSNLVSYVHFHANALLPDIIG